MALTTADLITNFRQDSGEGDINPTSTEIIGFLNRAYRGGRSVLPRLYPALSSFLGTAVQENAQDLATDTIKYAITNADTLLKLGYVALRYSGTDDYIVIQSEQIIQRPIEENEPLALNATTDKPAIGYHQGYLYIHPAPSTAVSSGLKVGGLYNPIALTASGSIVTADPVSDIVVLQAIVYYYEAKKEAENIVLSREILEGAIAALLKAQAGTRPMCRFTASWGGNLSRTGGRGLI